MPRRTVHLFDLVFKRLVHASSRAVVHFINGLFDTTYPPDSPVTYPNIEQISPKLRHLFPDVLVIISGHTYHLESQTRPNAEIALRVFEYGWHEGLRTKSKTAHRTTIRFPRAKVLLWSPRDTSPDTELLEIVFPDGSVHEYPVGVFKPLEHSIAELEQRGLVLLLPLYLLKLRDAVRKADRRGKLGELVPELRQLIQELLEAAKRGRVGGVLEEQDFWQLVALTERLYTEVYGEYTVLKETDMVQEELVTCIDEALIQGREQGITQGIEQGSRQSRLEIARRMKTMGFQEEQIIAATGLFPEDIAGL
jgi:hypothetical protein